VVLNGRRDLLHVGGELSDFSDTAALISNLDLVIPVDTSVAHLAGALANRVWVLSSA
jgi:ADP-heptose:LPS heptosyltransferase